MDRPYVFMHSFGFSFGFFALAPFLFSLVFHLIYLFRCYIYMIRSQYENQNFSSAPTTFPGQYVCYYAFMSDLTSDLYCHYDYYHVVLFTHLNFHFFSEYSDIFQFIASIKHASFSILCKWCDATPTYITKC